MNGITQKLGTALNGLLRRLDLRLVRYSKFRHDPLGAEAVFHRLKQRGVPFTTVIDIGASDGCWTRKLQAVFPDTGALLVEANVVHEPALAEFVAQQPGCDYVLAAAADRVGDIWFDDSDPWTGLASHEPGENNTSRLPCTTVDHEISHRELGGPFLLKLDTHGFEVPIIDGAQQTLQHTEVIIVETYNFDINAQALRFWELCDHLAQRGFRPIDLMEPMFRPGDQALWQFDLVFLRADRPEFGNPRYDG